MNLLSRPTTHFWKRLWKPVPSTTKSCSEEMFVPNDIIQMVQENPTPWRLQDGALNNGSNVQIIYAAMVDKLRHFSLMLQGAVYQYPKLSWNAPLSEHSPRESLQQRWKRSMEGLDQHRIAQIVLAAPHMKIVSLRLEILPQCGRVSTPTKSNHVIWMFSDGWDKLLADIDAQV